MEKGVSGVYAITCLPNGRKYVGSSADIRERFFRHRYKLRSGKHHITAMQADWNEHGEDAFTFQVLRLVAEREDRFDAEQEAMDAARTVGLLYNPAPSSRTARGYRLTPGQRAAISAAQRGHLTSGETRRKIGAANRQRWAERGVTPEFRERMAAIGRAGRGKPKSAEWRQKNSEAQKGHPKSPESVAKMRAARALLTEDQAREIKRRLAAGERGNALAAEYGVSVSTVSCIKRGKLWAHVTV